MSRPVATLGLGPSQDVDRPRTGGGPCQPMIEQPLRFPLSVTPAFAERWRFPPCIGLNKIPAWTVVHCAVGPSVGQKCIRAFVADRRPHHKGERSHRKRPFKEAYSLPLLIHLHVCHLARPIWRVGALKPIFRHGTCNVLYSATAKI